MDKFIDIHTHSSFENTKNVLNVKNIILPGQNVRNETICTAGWHPWFIEKYSLNEIETAIKNQTTQKQVIAIGECGIDRVIKVPLEIQKKVFVFHLKQAIALQKPIIIHAVKSYSEIAELLKKYQFKLPVIFHDYRGNEQQTAQLLKKNCYFSFGDSIFKPLFKMEKLKNIPLDKLFLETDESGISIQKIYIRAAELLEISVDDLKNQVVSNFVGVFGNGLVE